jgi:hypothetical protein
MRYKSLEEVVGKYGLTVDLNDKAQLSDWESRLKKLLETKQRELPNAKNPSLRHKVEREYAEVQDAFKFVSQQNVFTKLRRCVEEDKQEIFEHELKKPECRSILPSETDAEYATCNRAGFWPQSDSARELEVTATAIIGTIPSRKC